MQFADLLSILSDGGIIAGLLVGVWAFYSGSIHSQNACDERTAKVVAEVLKQLEDSP